MGGVLGFGVKALTRDADDGTGAGAVAVTATPEVEAPTGPTGHTGATGTTGPPATGPAGQTGSSASGPTANDPQEEGPDSTPARPIPLGEPAGAYGWSVAVIAFDPNATGTVERANRRNEREDGR